MEEVFSRPGSLTVYTSAPRHGLPPPNDCPPAVGPASYGNIGSGIQAKPESVAPFDTSAIREGLQPNGLPGPSEYFPNRRPRREWGTPSFETGPRFPENMYCSNDSPGPIYKPEDAWDKMTHDTEMLLTTKRPRVQPNKMVSNNVPTVFNPRDMKQFVEGMDGRMYPWWKKCPIEASPGPKYDVSQNHTSASRRVPEIDFCSSKTRRDPFKPVAGFGPADFNARQPLNQNGGVFLSKTNDPKRSAPRLFDVIVCKSRREAPGLPPLNYILKDRTSSPGCECPKAVTAPFKSSAPRLAPPPKDTTSGPGPSTYFQEQKRMRDIDPPLIGYSFSDPPEPAPFNTTADRFGAPLHDAEGPGPNDYYIYGFTDMMQIDLCRHPPAFINPRLGFLTSAEARPPLFQGFEFEEGFGTRPATIPSKWRNMRPKRIRTAPFHGPPYDPGTPAPNAYDTRSGFKYLKDHKSWWNPRDYTGSGFGNSGCERVLKIADVDYDNPGPKYGVKSEFPGPGGFIKRTGARFSHGATEGPGPRHKPHEKCDSMWRASQLGTPNVFLKGIDRIYPTAGGFHPQGPLDALGDRQRGVCRLDDYADEIVPKTRFDELVNKKKRRSSRKSSKEELLERPSTAVEQSEVEEEEAEEIVEEAQEEGENVEEGEADEGQVLEVSEAEEFDGEGEAEGHAETENEGEAETEAEAEVSEVITEVGEGIEEEEETEAEATIMEVTPEPEPEPQPQPVVTEEEWQLPSRKPHEHVEPEVTEVNEAEAGAEAEE